MSDVVAADDAPAAPSFDDYVAARSRALLRIAWMLTGDAYRAEDLVQTALGKTWPHWSRVSQSASIDAYVRKVMLTTYIGWWRRRWNAESPSGTPPEPAAASGDSADDRLVQRYDVLAALAALPKGQRAVVVLRYFEDLTEVETAAALGCSVGTVKSQNARALTALRASVLLAPMVEAPDA